MGECSLLPPTRWSPVLCQTFCSSTKSPITPALSVRVLAHPLLPPHRPIPLDPRVSTEPLSLTPRQAQHNPALSPPGPPAEVGPFGLRSPGSTPTFQTGDLRRALFRRPSSPRALRHCFSESKAANLAPQQRANTPQQTSGDFPLTQLPSQPQVKGTPLPYPFPTFSHNRASSLYSLFL